MNIILNARMLKISFIFLCFSSLFAGFENYIKKAEGKTYTNKIRNIDFIYMINLDKRPEKFEKSCKQLYPYGIYPYRFSAVNGWELTVEAINDIGLKYKPGMVRIMSTCYPPDYNGQPRHELFGKDKNCGYFCHCLAPGTIGIFLSHISVLQDAYDSGYERIWVMEDDIEVVRNPNIIPDLIDELTFLVGDWDMFFTDVDIRNNSTGKYVPCKGYAKRPDFVPANTKRFHKKKRIGKNFRKIGARFGATSIIYNRSGIEKLLNFFKKYGPFLPYDMDNYIVNGIKMYTVSKDIITNRINAPSDNGTPPPDD
ncbi:MAG: hypothetical protein AMS24_03220 [Chlamydiae bacterium SM23_39]|nr:MAG: hypothetical protein AMS24_03220 [Chlamydiae bacterium SM23_39]